MCKMNLPLLSPHATTLKHRKGHQGTITISGKKELLSLFEGNRI